ncbi:Chromatin structure-remodeling complex protein BSH [Phytophthora cinnamomi]|uniref:Chromatin structure-remodeling complex protein BSH n=1 Tax=Phytophthora cinnamomi TaxID=4785 RepID=UPI003559E8C6|nr:Chromatin structure-remodeling complex protein BSH [Phytophthora cinnamomi]
MAQGSGSYYDDYMRSNALLKHCSEKNTKKLLTDRSAYISFLEVQLERVSAACLTAQTFEQRLAELESAQLANDQKVGSLSKVFRLNQEYVEQTTTQAQSELAAHAAKVDAWMDKFSAELQRQEPRMATLEDQFRQCQEYLPRMAESNDAALHDVKHQTEHEIEELKAQVFALEARIEEMHSYQSATDTKVETLTLSVTHKLDQELALVRSSVSEKSFQLERTVTQLGNGLEQLVHQVDASWRAETSETAGQLDAHANQVQQRLDRLQQEVEHRQAGVKEVLKKCFDTQHLLSGTVVVLQSEVDDVKKVQTTTAQKYNEDMSSAIEDLRERQATLKNALQLLQACALEAQRASEDRCSKLGDRLAAAEDSFESMTDDLRRRVITALEDVGEKLHQDTGATTKNTLQAARKESETRFGHVMDISTALENRLRILEHTVLSLETKVQRSRAISEALGQFIPEQALEVSSTSVSDRLACHFNDSLVDKDPQRVIGTGERSVVWHNEQFYQDRIRELEERLHRKAQVEEEHRALFPERSSSKASSKSSISSSCYVSSFATEESKQDDEPRRTRTALKKTTKRNPKTVQSGGTSKLLKPKRLQTAREARDRPVSVQ